MLVDSLTLSSMPARLRVLREANQVVGERLADIKAGKETVQEVLHAASNPKLDGMADKPPMEVDEV